MAPSDVHQILERLAVIETKLDDRRADAEKIRKLENWRAGMTAATTLLAFEINIALAFAVKHF